MQPSMSDAARRTLETVQAYGTAFEGGRSYDIRQELPSKAGAPVSHPTPGTPATPGLPSWAILLAVVLAVAYL